MTDAPNTAAAAAAGGAAADLALLPVGCPLLLIRRAAAAAAAASGWSLLLPAGWVMPFWEALTHAGGWLCSVCVWGAGLFCVSRPGLQPPSSSPYPPPPRLPTHTGCPDCFTGMPQHCSLPKPAAFFCF